MTAPPAPEVYTIVVALRPVPPTPRDLVPGHQFLLVQNLKRKGRWELPGGRTLPGEAPAACAEREFLEETGHVLLEPVLVQQRTSPFGQGFVFVGRPGPRTGAPDPAEIQSVSYGRLMPPRDRLSFPDDPYEELFAAVRAHVAARSAPGPGNP